MAGIGKLFKFGGKKPPEPPRKDYDGRQAIGDGDSEEEGYIDPSTCHSMLPPSSGSLSSKMPNYPPPRPNHSSNSALQSLERSPKSPLGEKPSVKPRTIRSTQPGSLQAKPLDDYCDPWDARQQTPSSGDDYCDPVDMSPNKSQEKQMKQLDDYSDPWDSRQGQMAKPRAKPTGVRDEYIDPWDAQGPQVPPQPAKDSDDDSYTEPYDTGKVTVLDEQAKKMSLRGMRLPSTGSEAGFNDQFKRPQTQTEDTRPVDDYESPWESKGLIKPQPSQKSPSFQNQKPVQDSRPSDDYDKPWEWTAKKSPHFSGPTRDVSTKTASQASKIDSRPADDYDAPWEYNKRSSQLVSMATQQTKPDSHIPSKPPRVGIDNSNTGNKGIVIDTSKPLEKHQWYHGPLTRVEAECLLKYEEDCSFLVRDSESSRKDFSLSLKNNNAFMHLKIVRNTDNKFVLGQFSQPFDNVPEVIEHYSRAKLNIKGAEHKYLKNPVFPKHDYFVLEHS